jgi:hypothetical protein
MQFEPRSALTEVELFIMSPEFPRAVPFRRAVAVPHDSQIEGSGLADVPSRLLKRISLGDAPGKGRNVNRVPALFLVGFKDGRVFVNRAPQPFLHISLL